MMIYILLAVLMSVMMSMSMRMGADRPSPILAAIRVEKDR
jgi:hypothetical protein